MHDERISPAVSRVETPHDRPEDTPHYQALEDARRRRQRHPRRRNPARPAAAPPLVAEVAPAAPHAPDDIRGTKLDVVG